jgi:hypothetical protein
MDVIGIEDEKANSQIEGISLHPENGEAIKDRKYTYASYLSPHPSMADLRDKVGELDEKALQYDRSLHAIRNADYKLIVGSDGFARLTKRDEVGHTTSSEEVEDDLREKLENYKSGTNHSGQDVSMDENTKSQLENLGYL